MCSVPSKENNETDIRDTHYQDGILAKVSLVTLPSHHSNCCDCHCKDSQTEGEIKITVEKDDSRYSSYLDKHIFGLLIPALQETLIEASKWNALRVQKCRFNGLDYISQLLWNRNPRRSKIYVPPLDVFDIPQFKEYLRLHPRPYYPKSWLWTEDEAALYIQRYVRGWLARKREDVQEMRQFWKDIRGKELTDKKICIPQQHNLLGEVQDNKKPHITNEDLARCEKHRLMTLTHKTIQKLRERNTF